jgi:hypothetical protein
MELSTIQRIEQYMVDALIASPLIPLNVNVLRLADAIENEGVVSQTNNIVVRYTGSTDNVKNRIPMVFERRMSFELNFSCQNYLSSSGHDFATQLLTGAFITLNGGVPSGAFVQVIEPFTCSSEQYTGLTDNSQYTYTQTYVVTIEEALPYVALDPCVQRGDCRQIFPGYGVETRLPLGGIVDDVSGSIYVPSYTCTPQFTPDECCNPLDPQNPPLEDYDGCLGIRWSNELTASGDWVFICDPTCVFLPDPLNQPIYMLSNNSYTEDGRLVVTIFDAETKEPIREVFFCDTGKKLARYALELWTNISQPGGGISPLASKDASWFQGTNTGDFAVVKGAYAFLHTDPLDANGKQLYLDGGGLIGVFRETFITTPKGRFYFVQRSPQGKGWIAEDDFELASINSLWKLGCLPCSGNSGPGEIC